MTLLSGLKRLLGLGKNGAAAIDMMSCEEVMTLLYEYIDGELDSTTQGRMKGHFGMGKCECERALLFEVAFLKRVRSTEQDESLPEDLRERILLSVQENDD